MQPELRRTLALVITALRREAARMPRAGFTLAACTPAKALRPIAEAETLTALGAEGRMKACGRQWEGRLAGSAPGRGGAARARSGA
jgi:hypothetical protein